MADEKTDWGTDVGTGAESIEIAIKTYPKIVEFSEEDIAVKMEKLGLKSRGAIYEHLRELKNRGHLKGSKGAWKRVSD